MTSSRLEPPTHTTGAHRAHRRDDHGPRTLGQRPPASYEAYLDGLFTYCLSVLHDHDTATAVLGDVLAVAERRHARCPDDEEGRTAWLYALARWACLRSLAEQRGRRQGAHTGRPATVPAREPRLPPDVAERRRAELARLAWPEAAGTTPEQREALELAVRHGLSRDQVASVLGLDALAARELLASAACEVERTRAALAVVETGSCPTVARLTDDHQVLLSAALRTELVRHVDDCPRCRRVAERAGAAAPWPGATVTPARLPLVEAPRAATYVAMLHVPRARAGAPRFGPTGFPLDPKDHAARRDRMRARAVTTTVVAAVVAAPVLALWAAYRGAPLTGEGRGGDAVSAREDEQGEGRPGDPGYDRYENAGNASTRPQPRFTRGSRSPDVSVEIVDPGAPSVPAAPGQAAPGRLAVAAHSAGDTTVLTLTNAGGSPVGWSLWTDASWLYVSRASGTLGPGESATVYIKVDHAREPSGAWSARVGVQPSGAVLRIDGYGATDPGPTDPGPTDPGPGPSTPPPTSPDPDPTPTDPAPTDPGPTDPGPTGPTPTDPGPSDPSPTDPPDGGAPSENPPPDGGNGTGDPAPGS
ncbi:BACON domain-containing protein [Streptomyces tritici]|uniref:BACON domain-containing protein n=1 Tax=Streptomyces tritici TaxID=2054410 RepID=UPI003AEFA5CA